ncbi:hypothetical protein NUACC21_81660 [Scytonema sp. NUACC21]
MQPQYKLISAVQELPQATNENWFEYPVKVQPHHTDYAGIVWHGSYLAWMEEARVEYLSSIGIDCANLNALNCDLHVVELSIRYHQPMRMGMVAVVKTLMKPKLRGVRLDWSYKILSLEGSKTYVTAQLTVLAVDREKGTVMNQLPSVMEDVLQVIREQLRQLPPVIK